MARQPQALAAPGVAGFNSLANSLTVVGISMPVSVGVTANVVDHLVQVSLVLGAAPAGGPTTLISLYAYGSIDGTLWPGTGTTASEQIDGTTSKTLTWSANGNNAKSLGTIAITGTTVDTYKSEPLSVAAAFGGSLPAKYIIVAQNQSGVALAATGHSIAVSELSYS